MQTFLLALLVFIPITIAGSSLGFSPSWLFVLSAIAIIPLAKFIGDATEELSAKSGPALGGLLNATFGNATELLIGTFALQQGLVEVVKASITGSLIGNLLLVLGTAIFAGRRHTIQNAGIQPQRSTGEFIDASSGGHRDDDPRNLFSNFSFNGTACHDGISKPLGFRPHDHELSRQFMV